MQRPSCRISKVIDVIRLLTLASSHAQNIKEGLTHKSAAYCCVALSSLCREHAYVKELCCVTYVSNICCHGTEFGGQCVGKCHFFLEMGHPWHVCGYARVPYSYTYFPTVQKEVRTGKMSQLCRIFFISTRVVTQGHTCGVSFFLRLNECQLLWITLAAVAAVWAYSHSCPAGMTLLISVAYQIQG